MVLKFVLVSPLRVSKLFLTDAFIFHKVLGQPLALAFPGAPVAMLLMGLFIVGSTVRCSASVSGALSLRAGIRRSGGPNPRVSVIKLSRGTDVLSSLSSFPLKDEGSLVGHIEVEWSTRLVLRINKRCYHLRSNSAQLCLDGEYSGDVELLECRTTSLPNDLASSTARGLRGATVFAATWRSTVA